jgi:mannose-6-phosphate isomerase-like protein (cupin superfamily)
MPMPEKVNLADKLALFTERFQPRIVGAVNESHVKVVKLEGEFLWHHHAQEDEMFLVLRGRLRMRFREGEVALEPGELIVVPRGVEHCPYADEETHVMLVEPKTTVNTGSAGGGRTYVPGEI